MGTYTTNLDLYKPTVGETGWGSLVNTNFDELDGRYSPPSSNVLYVHPAGDNDANGLTWATAKQDILGAYDALPTGGGTIFCSGTSTEGTGTGLQFDASDVTRGLWICGPNDPNYASPPAGWRTALKDVTLIGVATQKCFIFCSPVWGNAAIWLSHVNRTMRFENLQIIYPRSPVRLGVYSDGTVDGGAETSRVHFRNCGWSIGGAAGSNGPGCELGYTWGCVFESCHPSGSMSKYTLTAASITAGTTARFTTSVTHLLAVGDTVEITGVTPSGYNGVWEVSAVAATTFDADIGTSPAAATVFGQALPVEHYYRAAFAHDGSRGFTAALPVITDGFLSGGGVWIKPATSPNSWLGGYLRNLILESDGVAASPPLLHIKTAAAGDTELPGAWQPTVVQAAEVADARNPTTTIKVEGWNTDPNVVQLRGSLGSGASGPVNSSIVNTSRGVGFRRWMLFGGTHSARRWGGPASAMGTNLADTDASTWGSKSGSATVTTGKRGPDGSSLAAELSSASGTNERLVYTNGSTSTTAGDWIIAGVWARPTVANPLTYVPAGYSPGSAGNISACFVSHPGTNDAGVGAFSINYPAATGDRDWQWFARGQKIVTGGGPGTLAMALRVVVNYPVEYYAPVLIHIPAGTVTDDEAVQIIRHLSAWPNTAAQNSVALLQGVNFHVPKGYVEMAEITDAAAPATNYARIYARDTGGKTELVVRFASGDIQQIAIQP